jgi:hypothetical protein
MPPSCTGRRFSQLEQFQKGEVLYAYPVFNAAMTLYIPGRVGDR